MVNREQYRAELREQFTTTGQTTELPYEVGVYTQGKVGSKAVLAALEDAFGVYPPDETGMYVWDYRRSDTEGVRQHRLLTGTRPRLLSDDPEVAKFMVDHPDRDFRVVTVVREPVAINLSSFFYNFIPKNPGIDVHELTDEEIIARLRRGESFSSPSFHLDWWDIEVEPMTGIRVYDSEPFPIEEGSAVYSADQGNRHTDLLVLRLENLAEFARDALSSYYGIDIPEIESVNTAEDAPGGYVDRYKRFKSEASLPEDWVSWQLESRYAQFFYSPEEIEGFMNKWVR
jgi:hypothetical protein